MKKNILTIDLDFMAKDIRGYNNCIPFEMLEDFPKDDDNDTLWKATKLVFNMRFKKHMSEEILKGTDDFIFRIIENNLDAEHYYVENHNEALDCFPRDTENYVFNIDFHHDMGYDFSNDQAECLINNWVLLGYDDGFIKTYSWIRRATSAFPVQTAIPYEHEEWRNIDPDKLPKFDIIVIVGSPEFTPKSIYNKFVKRYNKLGLVHLKIKKGE